MLVELEDDYSSISVGFPCMKRPGQNPSSDTLSGIVNHIAA